MRVPDTVGHVDDACCSDRRLDRLVPAALPARLRGARAAGGPGIAEDTVRQVVRTAREVVYAFAPDDTSQRRGSGPGVIRAYMATDRGVPRGFAEVDGAHRPGSTGTSVLYAPDVRLDRR